MKTTAGTVITRVAVVGTAIAVAFGLSACLQPGPLPSTSPSRGASTTSSPSSSSATPSATPTPADTDRPFAENCGILLTPTQVYNYNPNYVADTSYAPTPGSIPAAIAASKGQVCGWLDETSGALIEVAIGTPSSSDLATAKANAAGGTAISASGEHGYFAVRNGVGSAQFFFGSIWLDISSADFTDVADAQQLYPTVVQNQLHAGG